MIKTFSWPTFDDRIPYPANIRNGRILPIGESGPEHEIRSEADGSVVGVLYDNQSVVTLPVPLCQLLGRRSGNRFIGPKDEIESFWLAAKALEAAVSQVEAATSHLQSFLPKPPAAPASETYQPYPGKSAAEAAADFIDDALYFDFQMGRTRHWGSMSSILNRRE